MHGVMPLIDMCMNAAVQPEASVFQAQDVSGSRKSVRRDKLPLPASYDLLLRLFGELCLCNGSVVQHPRK